MAHHQHDAQIKMQDDTVVGHGRVGQHSAEMQVNELAVHVDGVEFPEATYAPMQLGAPQGPSRRMWSVDQARS